MQPKLSLSLLLLVLIATPIGLWFAYRDFPTSDTTSDVTVVELLPEQPAEETWAASAEMTADTITDLTSRGRIKEAVDLANYALALPRHPDLNDPYGTGHATLALDRMIDAFTAYEMWDEAIQFCTRPNAVNIGNAMVESKRIRLLTTAFASKRQLVFRSRILTQQLQELRENLDLRQDIDLHHNEICSPEDVIDIDMAANDAARKHIQQSQAIIDGYVLAMRRDYEKALAKLSGTETNAIAMARVLQQSGAIENATQLVAQAATSSVYRPAHLTTLAELQIANGETQSARETLTELNSLLAVFPADSSLRERVRPIVAATAMQDEWDDAPASMAEESDAIAALNETFPLMVKAPSFELPGVKDQTYSIDRMRGEPTLVVFYLGRGCLHCSRQLKHLAPASEDFERLGISIVGISCDSVEGLSESFKNYRGRIPFPLAADPTFKVFESYRLRPNAEGELLHGTFLVSAGGQVLWQDRGEEPFMDMDFLLLECERLLTHQKSNEQPLAVTRSN